MEIKMISRDEVLMGRDKSFPLNSNLESNLEKLLIAINKIRTIYGQPMFVSSGYRPEAINQNVEGAAKKSNHIECLAVDFRDSDGSIAKWCLANLEELQKAGLYLEDPRWTKNWCHLQVIAPASGKRIFIPSSAKSSQPDFWDGIYDSEFDGVDA